MFSDEKAINDFLKDPNKFLNTVIDLCRKNPELIHLLRMDDTFKNINLSLIMQNREGSMGLSNKLMVDKSCETPTHFVERNFDPNYCWNEWGK